MPYAKSDLASILSQLNLGSSVAETDDLLETARVETSVFSDLLADRVDLVPGTKGSGKSALYRIFVDFLPQQLFKQRKVVVAHGVQSHGDNVFHVFKDRFEQLDETDFVNFWCIYFVSLAHEHFIKAPAFKGLLSACDREVDAFVRSCRLAKVPEIKARKSLREILDWALNAIPWPKKITVADPHTGTHVSVDLFPLTQPEIVQNDSPEQANNLPQYVNQIRDDLQAILAKIGYQLWLMVDRLDEIFLRRSAMETRALRGLLRTVQIFYSENIRIKVFLRDDILDQVTSVPDGFTALTHVTARQSDRLRWSEEQILTLIVNRLFSTPALCELLHVNRGQLAASRDYQADSFYRVFPKTVHSGERQSNTLRWIYNHTADGRGVVTPRDVIDLLTKAVKSQQDQFQADPTGSSDWVIGSTAIRYGLTELSRRKKETLLKAEFPHFWPEIEKFCKGKTEYSEAAIHRLFGKKQASVVADLVGIGVLKEIRRGPGRTFQIPFLYRDGLELTQGKEE